MKSKTNYSKKKKNFLVNGAKLNFETENVKYRDNKTVSVRLSLHFEHKLFKVKNHTVD